MTTIEKDITIKAPPEKIYGYLEDPKHFLAFWPSLIEVEDVEKLPAGGHRFRFLYKMAGAQFTGVTETIEHKLYECLVDRAKGEIEGTFRWTFMPENGFTKVKLAVEYELPEKLPFEFEKPIIFKQNEFEAEFVLKNLKVLLEA